MQAATRHPARLIVHASEMAYSLRVLPTSRSWAPLTAAALGFASLLGFQDSRALAEDATAATVARSVVPAAPASKPVDITILQTVNLPWQAPEVIVTALAPLERLHVELVIDTAAGPSEDASDVLTGMTRSITWKTGSGKHRCEVRVSGVQNGMGFRRVESATVDVVPPLHVEFSPANVDLAARTLHFRSRSDIAFAELTLFDVDGNALHQATTPVGGGQAGKPITLSWPELPRPVAKLTVRAFGSSDSWADMEWSPIQIEVPHDPIFFRDTVVLGSRADKLAAAYQAVRRVVHEYAGVPGLHLYVLGLSNLEEKAGYAADRARAVAQYFQERGGVDLPVLAGSSIELEDADADSDYVQAFVAVDEPVHSQWLPVSVAAVSTKVAKLAP